MIRIGRFELSDKAIGEALSVQYGAGHRMEVRSGDWQSEYEALPHDLKAVVDGFREAYPDLPVGTYYYDGGPGEAIAQLGPLPPAGWEIAIHGRVAQVIP